MLSRQQITDHISAALAHKGFSTVPAAIVDQIELNVMNAIIDAIDDAIDDHLDPPTRQECK